MVARPVIDQASAVSVSVQQVLCHRGRGFCDAATRPGWLPPLRCDPGSAKQPVGSHRV